jgi:hypothetical protein
VPCDFVVECDCNGVPALTMTIGALIDLTVCGRTVVVSWSGAGTMLFCESASEDVYNQMSANVRIAECEYTDRACVHCLSPSGES